MPWQFGAVGLTESGGNRVIKYADALIDGVRLLKKSSALYLSCSLTLTGLSKRWCVHGIRSLQKCSIIYNARRCLLQKPKHCLERLYVCFNSRYPGWIYKWPYFVFLGMQLKYRTRNPGERLVAWLSTLYKRVCVIPIGCRNIHWCIESFSIHPYSCVVLDIRPQTKLARSWADLCYVSLRRHVTVTPCIGAQVATPCSHCPENTPAAVHWTSLHVLTLENRAYDWVNTYGVLLQHLRYLRLFGLLFDNIVVARPSI